MSPCPATWSGRPWPTPSWAPGSPTSSGGRSSGSTSTSSATRRTSASRWCASARTRKAWRSTTARRTSCAAFASGSATWCGTGGASCASRSGSPPSPRATARSPSSSPSWSRPRATSAASSRSADSCRRPRPSARCRTRCPTSSPSYTDIAEWRAVVARLAGFNTALDQVRTEAAIQGIRHEETPAAGLRLERRGPGAARWPGSGRGHLVLAASGRHRAHQRALGLGQEHALPRHRGHLALRPRTDLHAGRTPRPLPAPKALSPPGHPARGGELPDAAGRGHGRRAAGGARGGGAAAARRASWTSRPTGRCASRPASSSASPSPGRCIQKPELAIPGRSDLGGGRKRRGAPLRAPQGPSAGRHAGERGTPEHAAPLPHPAPGSRAGRRAGRASARRRRSATSGRERSRDEAGAGVAEGEGFEPPIPCGIPVFKTGAFNRTRPPLRSPPRPAKCIRTPPA